MYRSDYSTSSSLYVSPPRSNTLVDKKAVFAEKIAPGELNFISKGPSTLVVKFSTKNWKSTSASKRIIKFPKKRKEILSTPSLSQSRPTESQHQPQITEQGRSRHDFRVAHDCTCKKNKKKESKEYKCSVCLRSFNRKPQLDKKNDGKGYLLGVFKIKHPEGWHCDISTSVTWALITLCTSGVICSTNLIFQRKTAVWLQAFPL